MSKHIELGPLTSTEVCDLRICRNNKALIRLHAHRKRYQLFQVQ